VLEELSSANLIIQLLKKELTQQTSTLTQFNREQCKLFPSDDWTTGPYKGKRGYTSVSYNKVMGSADRVIETNNRFTLLASKEGISKSDVNTYVSPTLPRNSSHTTITNANRSKKKVKLQNTYPRLPRLGKPGFERRLDMHPPVTHNLLLLGDSHTKGLAEKISHSLGNSFKITGITKPNADIKGIASPSHLSPTNLSKYDTFIFLGGTCDISRNEAKKGLTALKEFIKRASNRSVILLGIPPRYDLPATSCIHTEVQLFNKRIRCLSLTYSHVKFVNTLTKRVHHTRHGLHLNTKGKLWISDNLAKVISDHYSIPSTTAPITLKWKEAQDSATQHLIPAVATKKSEIMDSPSPIK
jgi:hypothetical protein